MHESYNYYDFVNINMNLFEDKHSHVQSWHISLILLLQIVIVSHGIPIVKNRKSQSRTMESQLKKQRVCIHRYFVTSQFILK